MMWIYFLCIRNVDKNKFLSLYFVFICDGYDSICNEVQCKLYDSFYEFLSDEVKNMKVLSVYSLLKGIKICRDRINWFGC